MTVGGQLTRAFGVVAFLVLLTGVGGVVAARWPEPSVDALTTQVVPLRLANTQLRLVLSDGQRAMGEYLLSGDPRYLAAYDRARRSYPAALADLRRLATNGPERALIDAQEQRADAWWTHTGELRQAAPRTAAAAAGSKIGTDLMENFLQVNDRFDAESAAAAESLRGRGDRLRTLALLTPLGATTLAAALVIGVGVRTTRRITRPLAHLAAALTRLSEDPHARIPTDGPLAEQRAVATAVNRMAGEAQQDREAVAEAARLAAAASELGVRVRQHLAVQSALDSAAAGLGQLLAADHAVVRVTPLAADRALTTRWSRPGAPGVLDALVTAPGVAWLGDPAGWGDPAGQPGMDETTWVTAGVADDPRPIPPGERAALLAAGAQACLIVGFNGGSGAAGTVTLLRCAVGATWTSLQVRAAGTVAADLGRGLLHAQLYEREQELVARLRDLDNAKTDFMSTVSHELRTPLTSIAGYVEMLRDSDGGAVTAEQHKMLDVIDRNASRLRSLIEDLLVLSQIEAGTFKTNRQDVDVGWLVNSAVAAVGPAALSAGVALRTAVQPELAGHADAEQIDRLLMNLMSNAVKFTPRGGQVTVHAERVGSEIELRVTDTGIGIPDADQRHLFTKFFRAGNATLKAIPGTGLGLAIVRTIVANHAGQITVTSREGVGTTITVRLPG